MSKYAAWFLAESRGKKITGMHSAIECDPSGEITAVITIFLHGDVVIGEYDEVTGNYTEK